MAARGGKDVRIQDEALKTYLYHCCNFSINLKLFKNKKLILFSTKEGFCVSVLLLSHILKTVHL